ncbi:hypothetical protein ACLOAU_05650 [Niabella sp. CJ426]|uniref:hypothetical protein n=1 Tax=Niabella sp. CJ426 TaxID=3393740 RepID=UPI003D01B315
MKENDTYDLSNVDPDDISEILQKVEKSFHIQFKYRELESVKNFGELCDIIEHKVNGIQSEACATQQAYYRIREAIALVQEIDKVSITLESKIEDLFPRHDRNKKIRALQQQLGIAFDILSMQAWFSWLIAGGVIGSLLFFFFQWQVAVTGILFFIAIGRLAGKFFSKELQLNTVRQLTEKLSREHYIDLRRDASTINRNEIAQKVKELFKADLVLEDHLLTREATFS